MADFNMDRLSETATSEEIIQCINRMIDELNYVLENIDEENITDNMKNKLNGGINNGR